MCHWDVGGDGQDSTTTCYGLGLAGYYESSTTHFAAAAAAAAARLPSIPIQPRQFSVSSTRWLKPKKLPKNLTDPSKNHFFIYLSF